MTRHDDEHTDVSSIPIRVPVKFVVAIIVGVLFGGMGVNTALFESAPSEERVEILRLITQFGEQATTNSTSIATLAAALATLRDDLRAGTASRFTQEDAEALVRDQERKHDALEQADAQARRSIAALERQIDELQRGR